MREEQLEKVLIVEDEEDIRLILRMALETVGGVRVELCSSGFEATEKALAFEPDLILLDVMMPTMDGPETLAELRKVSELEEIPVIFLTALTQKKDVLTFKELGACDVISKPFDPMKIFEKVNESWIQAREGIVVPA